MEAVRQLPKEPLQSLATSFIIIPDTELGSWQGRLRLEVLLSHRFQHSARLCKIGGATLEGKISLP